MDFDTAVKMQIYETLARTARAPASAEVAAALGTSPAQVEAAFERYEENGDLKSLNRIVDSFF